MVPHIEALRLSLDRFSMADADELFQCITPTVTRFMAWDPPSFDDYKSRCEALSQADEAIEVQFVIRRKDTRECLGIVGIERLGDVLPELGIWMKETAHRQGYGREAVEAVAKWASRICAGNGFI
jgi:RimJ/RimL family protein N-acetyltransferase